MSIHSLPNNCRLMYSLNQNISIIIFRRFNYFYTNYIKMYKIRYKNAKICNNIENMHLKQYLHKYVTYNKSIPFYSKSPISCKQLIEIDFQYLHINYYSKNIKITLLSLSQIGNTDLLN